MGARSNAAPRILRRIAVVGEDADVFTTLSGQRFAQSLQFSELILRECLGRKQIQRPARVILQHRVKDRGVVAERLTGRRRGDHDGISPRQRVGQCLCLMRIQLADPARLQRGSETTVENFREGNHPGGHPRQPANRGDVKVGRVGPIAVQTRSQPLEGGIERGITAPGTCCQAVGSGQSAIGHEGSC
jgi:hypothetical protein